MPDRRRTTVCIWISLLLLFQSTGARMWTDVVDPAIFLASAIDIGRLGAIEKDPFNRATNPLLTAAPTPAVEESQSQPTPSPSGEHESSSTNTPTAPYDFILGNGGCDIGLDLFQIRMFDSWGDGWDSAVMQILRTEVHSAGETQFFPSVHTQTTNGTNSTFSETVTLYEQQKSNAVFQGQLEEGREGYFYTCLDLSGCYRVVVDGGTWMEEIKWEIRQVNLDAPREEWEGGLPFAKGLAPANCQFAATSLAGETTCATTCGAETVEETSAPSAAMVEHQSDHPTELPTLSPTNESTQRTIKNAIQLLKQTEMPSDAPSLVPSTHESGNPSSTPSTDAPTLVPSASENDRPSMVPSAYDTEEENS